MAFGSIKRAIQQRAEVNPRFQRLIRKTASVVGYNLDRTDRLAYEPACRTLIEQLNPPDLDTCEISPSDNPIWRDLGYRSYRALDWPEFDMCAEPVDPSLVGRFDLAIADQVFEHLLWPYRGGRNLYQMLKPGGHALLMTPFLLRIHGGPQDCSRWSEIGMRHLLAECGFPIDDIQTWSWGNREVIRRTLYSWPRMGWHRTVPANQTLFPFVIWALARKPG